MVIIIVDGKTFILSKGNPDKNNKGNDEQFFEHRQFD
jgi:hypothetical protein